MGGTDKCLLALRGKPILSYVLERISPQTGGILINSNRPARLFASFGWPVVPDVIGGFQGPLIGILTGMTWARRTHPNATHILSVACDTPFLPHDLAQRLREGLGANEIAIARDNDQPHPVIGLWPVTLANRLATDIETDGVRGIRQWLHTQQYREIVFDAEHFCNVNTPDDLDAAANLLPPTLT